MEPIRTLSEDGEPQIDLRVGCTPGGELHRFKIPEGARRIKERPVNTGPFECWGKSG
jgi:hypothetical protein